MFVFTRPRRRLNPGFSDSASVRVLFRSSDSRALFVGLRPVGHIVERPFSREGALRVSLYETYKSRAADGRAHFGAGTT